MEAICSLGVSALAFAAAFVLCPSKGERAIRGKDAHPVPGTLVRVGSSLAQTRLAAALLKVGPLGRLALELRERLGEKGFSLGKRQAASLLIWAYAAIGLLGAFVSQSVLGALVALIGAAVSLVLRDASLRRRRSMRLAQEMPGIFRTLAVAMGAGQTLSQAIAYVASREKGEASREFKRAALRLSCGDSTEEVLEEMARTLDAPGAGLLATALLVSHRTGSPLRSLFQRSAQLVERASESERLLAVKTAQVRLSVRVVCLLPVVLVGLLSLISTDFRAGLATPAGAASVAVAAALDIAAIVIIRSLVKGVLR